jgi:3-isopropylmalate dehydrogenase
MSFSMMLRYSFDQVAEADLVDQAVNDALSSKRTGDIMAPGCEQTGTAGMTAAVIDALDHLAR